MPFACITMTRFDSYIVPHLLWENIMRDGWPTHSAVFIMGRWWGGKNRTTSWNWKGRINDLLMSLQQSVTQLGSTIAYDFHSGDPGTSTSSKRKPKKAVKDMTESPAYLTLLRMASHFVHNWISSQYHNIARIPLLSLKCMLSLCSILSAIQRFVPGWWMWSCVLAVLFHNQTQFEIA